MRLSARMARTSGNIIIYVRDAAMRKSDKMSVEIKGNKIIHQGFTHTRHCFYRSEINVPKGYELVNKGKTQINDMAMVHVPPFPKAKWWRKYLGKEAKIKAKWEVVSKENVGKSVSQFKAVIRQ